MTDKVQKIREEVARIQLYTQSEVLKQILDYIDKIKEEPVSDDFEKKFISFVNATHDNNGSYSLHDFAQRLYNIAKEELKEPISEDLEKIVEEIAEPTILNAYGTKELARRLRNTIYGTSVSEDLEEAIDTYLATYFGGEKEKQDWPFLKKMAIYFAKWQKQKDSIPVSDDLGEYINELSKQFPEVSFAKLSRIAVRVAKWQKDRMNLELTWEDMRELYIIFAEVDTEIELCNADITAETLGYYQEVLKRFKEKRNDTSYRL